MGNTKILWSSGKGILYINCRVEFEWEMATSRARGGDDGGYGLFVTHRVGGPSVGTEYKADEWVKVLQ